ncbi:MAG: HAD family hydrolase, partial [Bacteroidota bacterium]
MISHGQALEASGEIDIVAFDKTGTLTVGKPQVRKALKDVNLAEEAGSIAHALAQKSKHPLSLAIAAYESQSEPDTLESIHETAGQG